MKPTREILAALSRSACNNLSPAGQEEPAAIEGVLNLLLASREVREDATVPDQKAVGLVAANIWDHTAGDAEMVRQLGRMELDWIGCRRDYFKHPESIWTDWNTYRLDRLTPEDMGYLDLLKDGQEVAPDFVACPEEAAGAPWCSGVGTVLEVLPTATGRGLRLGYDAEDVPPLMALSVLGYAGYDLPAAVRKSILDYRGRFTESTGIDFGAECRKLVRYVEYNPLLQFQERGLKAFVEQHRHFFDAQIEDEAADSPGLSP
jgi:hypothetical protein